MHPWESGHWLPGVLSETQIRRLWSDGYLDGIADFKNAADYSSIDLTLSNEGYKMKAGSIKPCGQPDQPYKKFLGNSDLAERLPENEDNIFVLKANECYVFKLKETLAAGKLAGSNIFGMATAKSSIGRVDVIARLIIDGMYQYEVLDPESLQNSTGDMFLEIIPISFDVCVKPGISLSQLRLFYGDPAESEIRNQDFIKGILLDSKDGDGYLSVDLRNTKIGGLNVTAFRACVPDKGDQKPLKLWKRTNKSDKPDPCRYWRLDQANEENRFLLKSNAFYLLRSKERLALPSRVAVYARPMDETLGEMRIHYAGFAHPYFGSEREDRAGTPLIFEVRAHNVSVNLDHNERLAKLIFYRMSEEPKKKEKEEGEERSYDDQELELSKYFGAWPPKLEYKDEETGVVVAIS